MKKEYIINKHGVCQNYIKPEIEILKVWKKTYNRRCGHITWQVSNQGQVKKNGAPYECRLNHGYKVFGPGWRLNRSVAMLFISNPNNYNEVDHINGNPLDDRAINLQWCTHKQNCNNPITLKRRSESMKGKYKGENHPMYGVKRHRVYHPDGTYHYEKQL